MPLEPVPWDRKDYFKDRKRDRSESLGPGARWRESSAHHSSREFRRWGSPEFRRPAGHGKQGGWHLFPEESGRGYASSRSCDKMVEEDNWRSTVSRGDGKYGRNYRESRGSFSRRDWREHPWQNNIGALSFPRRHPGANNDRRPVDDMLPYSPHPHSNFANTWQHRHFRDQHNKMGGVNGFGRGRRFDRESSLGLIDWKPLKWTRPGGLSSRDSGLRCSSRSRSIGVTDPCERKAGLQQKDAAAAKSNSGEAAACETSATYEETHSKKKPRLNWGEGLAKFEKKKVEGPDVSSNDDCPVTSLIKMEPSNILHPSVVDKGAKGSIFSDFSSPTTQSTVACSSPPGVDDKLFEKAAAVDNDVSPLRSSPVPGSQNHPQVFSFNLEKVDVDSLIGLGSSLFELVQSDDLSSADSNLLRPTTMNKLLILKADISKVLEVTEIEIDLLENELKSLKSEPGDKFPSSEAVDSLLLCYNSKSCDEHVGCSHNVACPGSLEMVSSNDPNMEKMVHSTNLHCAHNNGNDDDINRPGTAMPKFVEPLPSINEVSSCNVRRFGTCLEDLGVIQSTAVKCLVPCTYRQAASASACGDGNSSTEVKDGMEANLGASFYPSSDDTLYSTIMSCNRETAKTACEVFAKLLPEDCGKISNIGASSESCSQNGAFIMERIAEKKRFARFKERVIALKFKALHHLWKKDMRVLSIRKIRPKSHKKPQFGVRTIRNAHQKKRSSNRSHFPFPGNPLNLVPTSELINCTSQLLSESQDIIHRSTLKMPALILDQKEKMISKFLSSNGLVEDPLAIEKERSMINPWTPEERAIFLEKFAAFGKDFRKIASFIDYKTTADCVEFYYKNHKSHYFQKIKKKDGGKLKKLFSAKTDLIASGKRCNHEVNAASLEMLNAASVMADGIARNRKLRSGRSLWRGHGDMKSSRGKESITERSSSFDILQDEREAVAADVLAGICGSLSCEAMSSCMASSVQPVEGNNDKKCVKVRSRCKQRLMPDITQNIDDATCSEASGGEMDPTDWTDGEKAVLLQAISSFGKDFAMIAQCVGTKSHDQCKVFFSKAQKSLRMNPPIFENIGSLVIDDANGGRSDSDDACNEETGSGIGTDTSGIKAGEELGRNVSADLIESKEINGEEVDREDVNMVSNACVTKGKSILETDGDANVLYSSGKSGSVRDEGAIIVSESIDIEKDKLNEMGGAVTELVPASEIIEPCHSNSVAEDRLVSDISSECRGNGLEGSLTCLDRDNLHGADTDAGDELKNKVFDSSTTLNTSVSPIGISCPRLSSAAENQPRPCLDEKPHFSGSLEDPPTTVNLVLQDSAGASLQCEETASQNLLSSTCDFQGSRDISGHNSSSNGAYDVHNPGNLLGCVEAGKIIQHFPLRVPVKDVNVGMTRSSSVTELPVLSKKIEQADDHHETQLQCLSDSEKTSGSGDVKLFGKILTHPSSSQKPEALENISFTSYWDGNTIRSGFSILPDTPILRQPLPVLADNQQLVNGPSVNGSNGLIDYQMFRNRDGLNMQPSIMVDVKHCQEASSEMQRRNGFETIPSLVQQGEGMVAMNGVSRPGILVGGLSSGVSDPVAAIKMHYSNAVAHSGVQTGNIMSKDES